MAQFLNKSFWKELRIKEELMRLNRPILKKVMIAYAPVLLVFIIFTVSTGSNIGKARQLVKVTIPATQVFINLEKDIMLMQKWLTFVSATRNEPGFENGFPEADKYFNLAQKEFTKLKSIFKDDPDRLKAIDELNEKTMTYYEMGKEVAGAYIDDGTASGNDMLSVFTEVEQKLNTQLNADVTYFRKESDEVNRSLSLMLISSLALFIAMGLIGTGLGVVTYLFLVKREQLNVSNRKLQEAMDSLWGEMELAKKIQTVLLPKRPAMSGFDIAAQMIPADEVGGDYYDIINVADRDWIVIGDVSGHGVPAGLVMMMVQTAIHVTLTREPELPPSELLVHINKTIHFNIKQLGEDKYMTITVLAAHKDGTFHFSGLHQDIMIYRAKTDQVELAETNGMWIGIWEDIHGMVADNMLKVEKEDAVLLYTDGITEAIGENGEMFSSEKLAEVFKGCARSKPEEIKNNILGALQKYKRMDDVSLVVMKRHSD
jgi:serine phosphatase RsbU (regulator of sigma subunit)